jgi:mannose-6-phosphate isomerase-like protein (cupin superfamily)
VTANNLQPYRNTRDDLPFQFLGVPTLLRATADTTNGAFGLIEHPMLPPGFASPYHVHHREDESFYMLQGRVAFVCDGKWLTAGPGDFVFGPKNIPHGFKVTGVAFALRICAPYRLSTSKGFSSCVELPRKFQARGVNGHDRALHPLAADNHLGELVQIAARRVDLL